MNNCIYLHKYKGANLTDFFLNSYLFSFFFSILQLTLCGLSPFFFFFKFKCWRCVLFSHFNYVEVIIFFVYLCKIFFFLGVTFTHQLLYHFIFSKTRLFSFSLARFFSSLSNLNFEVSLGFFFFFFLHFLLQRNNFALHFFALSNLNFLIPLSLLF